MNDILIKNVKFDNNVGDAEAIVISKSKFKLRVANAKNIKWAYEDNKKYDQKRRITDIKEPLSNINIQISAAKKHNGIEIIKLKQEAKKQLNKVKAKETSKFKANALLELEEKYEVKSNAILLSNSDKDVLMDELNTWKSNEILEIEKYEFSNDTIASEIESINEKLKVDIEQKSSATNELVDGLKEKLITVKEEVSIKVNELKEMFKQERDLIVSEFKTEVESAKKDYLESKQYLAANKAHLNFFNEMITEDSIVIGKNEEEKKLYIEELIEIDSIRSKIYAKKIELINKAIIKLEDTIESKKNFNSALKLIELRIKLDSYLEIAELIIASKKDIDGFLSSHDGSIIKQAGEEYKVHLKQTVLKEKETMVEEIARAKKEHKEGMFSTASLKNTIKHAKHTFASNIREAKLRNPYTSYKENIRFKKHKLSEDIISRKKIMWSKVDEAQRKVPVKTFEGQKIVSSIASFLLPGLGQAINKQYVKAMIMGAIGILAYAFFLPAFFGVFSYEGNGIFGLIKLSKVLGIGSSGAETYTDARYMLVEGVLAIFMLILWFINTLISSRDAYVTAKYAELGVRVKNRRDLKRYLTSNGLPYVISLPAIIGILFTVLLPLATTILVAFTNYGGTKNAPPTQPVDWIGFDNFKEIFSGDYGKSFFYVSGWTIMWAVTITVLVLLVGTMLAMVVDNKRIKGKKLWFMIYILPWAVPAFATILFFSAIFSRDTLTGGSAWVNQILGTSIEWKQNTETAMYTRIVLIMIQLWLGNAYVFMLMTGVKRSISNDYYEAANIDGANAIKQFTTITAPIILLQLLPLLIGQFTFNLNNYGLIWMFNDGGPVLRPELIGTPGATDILISLIFKITTASNAKVGLAAAFTLFYSLFVVGLSAVGMVKSKTFKKERRHA